MRGSPRGWPRRCVTRWRPGAGPTRQAESPVASIATPSGRPTDALTRLDAVVVGGGAIGAGCAYELARAGLRVMVIERSEPAAEASGASAGILSVPVPSRRDALAVLGRLSRDLYDPLAIVLREEAAIDIGIGRTGHIRLCMTREEMSAAERFVADPTEREAGASLISSRDELNCLEPAISQSAHGALYL